MRIRKRLALCSIPTPTAPPPLPDLHLRRSEAPPPDQRAEDKLIMKPKQLQFADDHDNTNNDIREIVNICDVGGGDLQSKIEQDVDKLVPLKKRRKGILETNDPKTNNKCAGVVLNSWCAKKSKRGNVIMEGSRCSRVNGRGWRCCQPTLVGYSLCDHHLGKGKPKPKPRPRPTKNNDRDSHSHSLTKKIRTKVGMVKARSINTLICSPKFH